MLGVSDHRWRGVGRIGGLAVVVALVAVAVGVVALTSGDREPPSAASTGGLGDYPDEWKTDLQDARSRVSFELVLPEDSRASVANITDVFVWPEGHAVALRFPAPPAITDEPVRQGYLEIFETPWTGDDPATAWAEDVANAGIEGESAFEIEGIPALGVTAQSPTDIERANPAFLRFVYKGLDIQISGGDDLKALVEIAQSMIR
jgi:hypothetical protein